ncbi:MAG: hypothetical protein QOF62_881 [Pyrinomonadaceae bacterium]|nr:hypothetical protein [Pyrinomonadaceae bacterium]
MRKSKKLVSVITADIIHSRSYSPSLRRRVNTVIRRSFTDVARKYPKAVRTRLAFRITAGDEFQCVFFNVPDIFDLLTYLRASTATSGVEPLIRFRASIGIGGITVSSKSNSYEEDGEAFVRARTGLDQLKKQRQRLTKVVTGDAEVDKVADTVLLFLDHLQLNWTAAQWEAVKWSLLDLKREEIAKKIDVAHQNVTKRLSAAGWSQFREGSKFLRELLEGYVHPK